MLTTLDAVGDEESEEKSQDETEEKVKAPPAKKNKIDKTCTKVFTGIPPAKELGDRLPSNFRKKTLDLWEFPDVRKAVKDFSPEDTQRCVQAKNIDMWINDDLIQQNLVSGLGYTVFNIDCRDSTGDQIMAFIVILSNAGEVTAVKPIKKRAECVNMKDTKDVLFTSIGEAGSFLWQWQEGGNQIKLPFYADSHTLWYSAKLDAYFGMEMASQTQKNAPSVATAFNSSTGEQFFSYVQDGSHINFVSLGEDDFYVSLRSSASLQKVKIDTQEVVWTLGGTKSDFVIEGFDGQEYIPDGSDTWRDDFGSWHHQHKFQHLDDTHFSLFDNHVNEEKTFIDDEVSRMVVLEIDETNNRAKEIFSFKTGDQAMIYGGADILPSGNVLGHSYPDNVYPEIEDQSYQQNIWEVTADGELAWRVGFKGPNVWDPTDVTSPYTHRIDICEEAPVGWVIYNVERFYLKPPVTQPCMEGSSIKLRAFNTIRSQSQEQGVIFLYDLTASATVSKQIVNFQKSWIQDYTTVEVPEDIKSHEFKLVIVNAWKDSTTVTLGALDSLPTCDSVVEHRIVY